MSALYTADSGVAKRKTKGQIGKLGKRVDVRLPMDFAHKNAYGLCVTCSDGVRANGRLCSAGNFVPTHNVNMQKLVAHTQCGMYYLSEGSLYRYADGANAQKVLDVDGDIIQAVTYRNKVFINCPNMGLYVVDYTATQLSSSSYDNIAVCSDRLFALDGSRLYFTNVQDGMNFSKEQYVDLPISCGTDNNAIDGIKVTVTTNCAKQYNQQPLTTQLDTNSNDCVASITAQNVKQKSVLAVRNKYLYVLGANAVLRVEPNGNLPYFKVKQLCAGVGNVAMQSVVNVGKYLIFATEQGLFCLRGDTVFPVFQSALQNVCNCVNFTCVTATLHDGYYVASLPFLRPCCGNDVGVTMFLNVSNWQLESCWQGLFDSFLSTANVLLATRNGVCCSLTLPSAENASCSHGTAKFCNVLGHVTGAKHLFGLDIQTSRDVTVYLCGNGITRKYFVSASKFTQRVNVCAHGSSFDVTLTSDCPLDVAYISLSAVV